MGEHKVVEISRRESVNGYVYEYDESLVSVEEIQRAQRERIDWWLEGAATEQGAEEAA